MPATAGKYGSKDSLTPSGRQKTASTRHQEELAMIQGQIAQDLYNQTQGLRSGTTSQLQQFLNQGTLPTGLRVPLQDIYRTGREGLEQQYSNAREEILSGIPSQGGQLNAQLADLAMSRAGQVGRLRADLMAQYQMPIRQQLFSAALGTGFGTPPTTIAGLSGAGSQFGQVAARSQAEQLEREQRSKEEMQQIGQMIGMAAG